jgi:peptide/nickel transport system substrate-binding protein
MHRKLMILALFVAIFTVIAACAAPPPQPAEQEAAQPEPAQPEETMPAEPAGTGAEKVLRFGLEAADLGTLDPHFAATTNDRTVVDMVFNGLVRYKPGVASEFEADLATEIPEPTMEDGKQVWTFNLREGVMCHPSPDTDAYELTADDVVYSLQKSANPDRSAYAGEYDGMSVEKVDDYTVNIIMEQPISPVLFLPKVADYAGGFIVCSKAIEAMGDEAFKTHPVGTGPFMFESYTPQDTIRLVANEDYFRGAPKLDSVLLRFMPDISSRELGLKAGELDAINGLDEGEWIDQINAEEGLVADVFGVGEVATIYFNTTVEPLDDPRVRKAIAYALDRDEFLALFGEQVAENVYSPVPAQFLAGGLTQAEVQELGLEYAYDPEMAKQLLEEAGYADGFSFDLVTSEMGAYRKNYESMQAQLAQVGIDLNIDVVDHSTMHSLIREDVNPIVIYVAWRPNADVYLTRFFHSDSIVVTGAKPDTNFAHYDKIDDLIEEARVATDPDEQVQLWKEAQIQILEDMVAYPLHYQNQVYARTDAVDYGHPLESSLALYPQITENTDLTK